MILKKTAFQRFAIYINVQKLRLSWLTKSVWNWLQGWFPFLPLTPVVPAGLSSSYPSALSCAESGSSILGNSTAVSRWWTVPPPHSPQLSVESCLKPNHLGSTWVMRSEHLLWVDWHCRHLPCCGFKHRNVKCLEKHYHLVTEQTANIYGSQQFLMTAWVAEIARWRI